MKYRCRKCGALFFTGGPLETCDLCGGGLKDVTPLRERAACAKRGAEVEVIHGIPACDHFVLNNAPGSRCLYCALPGHCALARLPDYQPRVGIVTPAGVER